MSDSNAVPVPTPIGAPETPYPRVHNQQGRQGATWTRCSDCGETWTGQSTAHCVRCHSTFSTDGGFDKHLVSRSRFEGCYDPAVYVHKKTGTRIFAWNEKRNLWTLAPPKGGRSWSE